MILVNAIGEEIDIYYNTIERVSGIIFNKYGEIAILIVKRNNYHVLPGGGIECGEDMVTALLREVNEEVGATINNITELGYIIEYINNRNLKRITYCYLAEVLGELTTPQFTKEEIFEGYELSWLDVNEALTIIENDLANYDEIVKIIKKQSFVPHRELGFLKAAITKNYHRNPLLK